MGISIYSTFIKVEQPKKYKIEYLAEFLFKGKILDRSNIDFSKKQESRIYVSYLENGISLESAELALGLLLSNNKSEVIH
ncbi:MAG: hypothetical protein AAF960_24730, partial [Bacteroidota bacterium]